MNNQGQKLPKTEGTYEEQIQQMTQYMNQYTKDSKYLLAESAKNRIAELKIEYKQSLLQDLEAQHARQTAKFVVKQNQDHEEWKTSWNNKFEKLQQDQKKQKQKYIEVFEVQYKNYENSLEKSITTVPVDSAVLINLRKIRKQYVNQKKFAEAEETKNQQEALEKEEYDSHQQSRAIEIRNNMINYKKQQDQKMIQFQQQLQQELDKFEFERKKDEQRFILNQKEEKSILEKQQWTEMDRQHKIEKSIFNPGKTYIERYEEKYSAVAKITNKKEVVPFRNTDSMYINTNNLY